KDDPFDVGVEHNYVETWMELLTPTTAEVLAYYDHPHWGKYAAITQNHYGKGITTYIGCMTSSAVINRVLEHAVKQADLWDKDQELEFPLITKSGTNQNGKTIRYYFNYSDDAVSFAYPHNQGTELFTGAAVNSMQNIEMKPW